MYRKLFSALILIVLFAGCGEQTRTYTGKQIELDFRDIRNFEDGDWLKIGNTQITHSNNYEQLEIPLFIPASRTVYSVNGQERREPRNPFSIALLLAVNVDQYLNHSEGQVIRIVEEKRHLTHISAIVYIEERDGNEFTVEAPVDYPLKIRVVE